MFERNFDWKFDFKKISKSASVRIVISDTTEGNALATQQKDLAAAINAVIIADKAVETHFDSKAEPLLLRGMLESITVFTTRADTLFGATFMVLAPEHPLVLSLRERIENWKEISVYVNAARKKTEIERTAEGKEKTGIELKGVKAINPATKEEIPIYIADYVLSSYGTGAIMAVPAHDGRDFEFARKYGLPFRVVIQPEGREALSAETMTEPFDQHDRGTVVNSGPYNGLTPRQAIARMTADAEARGFGKAETVFRLRDWGISRQRYWGTPIPVIHCAKCGIVPVPEDQLPVLLPDKVALTGMGESPLASVASFANVKCPKCGGAARRETDTMDTFMDSSWYFYRYTDNKNAAAPFDPAVVRYWFPIDQYIGGITHAILHLIYSRFFCKVMRDLGLVNHDEPVTRLFCQGMVLKGGVAMSKSKGNVVGALDMADKVGCDTARVYTLFAAPPEKDLEWSEESVAGCARFLQKVWRLVERHAERLRAVEAGVTECSAEKEKAVLRKAHQTLKRVTDDYERRWHFNTCVSGLMELANELQAQEPLEKDASPAAVKEALELLVLMLTPMAPHISEELWEMLGHKEGLTRAAWPAFKPALAVEEQFEVVIQINGRVRGKMVVEGGLAEEELLSRARREPAVTQHMDGKSIVKSVVVPNKLVNLVVK